MKSLLLLSILALSQSLYAESVTCRAEKTIKNGFSDMKTDAELTFDLNRATKTISNVLGHIYVQNPYAEAHEEISTENSYMGFFQITSTTANPNYRPLRYKKFTQFKNFDATHTAGEESGMWGTLVIDLTSTPKFEARYIFQAGDHMGGTVLFNCR